MNTRVLEWRQVEGQEPGVEYAEQSGLVWVRVPDDDWFREKGPARVIGGSVEATVRQLLRELHQAD